VQRRAALSELGNCRLAWTIAPECDEELDLDVLEVGEDTGHDTTTPAGTRERARRVDDRPRHREAVDRDEVDPLDMPDDRNARHSSHLGTRARSAGIMNSRHV
jgi:hypothetical protein